MRRVTHETAARLKAVIDCIRMRVLNSKSILGTALSLWLGVLACLVGCAPSAKAANSSSTRQPGVVNCPDSGSDAGDSCCQHNPGSSGKNRRHAMSCCPTETALTQKQNLISPDLTVVFTALLPLVHVFASSFTLDRSRENDVIRLQTGRDILQLVHVLRI